MPDFIADIINAIPLSGTVLLIGLPLLIWFLVERGLTVMMFFQQEEYDNGRFIGWIDDNKAFDRALSIWCLIVIALGTLTEIDQLGPLGLLLWPLVAIGLLHGIFVSRRNRRASKKPLVKTPRVKRIFFVYLDIMAVLGAVGLYLISLAPSGNRFRFDIDFESINFIIAGYNWQTVTAAAVIILMAQAVPFMIILANILLEPVEDRIKTGFRKEAEDKFAALKPQVIAITGSFGKTSTKHILSHILSFGAPTLATPGSVNTEMGITRVIRETLTPEHKYFIVEMGAYGIGSIARLCKLTPPNLAMVTAVGAAHYERFKSLANVARAKFEIADAVFKQGGKAIVSTDGIDADLLADRKRAVAGEYVDVGANGDVKLVSSEMTKDGLVITVDDAGEEQIIKAPLYGDHQAGNIVMAAAAARALGLPWSAIKGALKNLPQIRHRLEVTKAAGQPTIINDAYNSNPIGFAEALACLDVLVNDGGRRILITPGMVELGDKHDSEHARLGALAAKHSDILLIVSPDRIKSFETAAKNANDGHASIMTFTTQAEAEAWASANARAGDVILFENNLPDLFEATVRF